MTGTKGNGRTYVYIHDMWVRAQYKSEREPIRRFIGRNTLKTNPILPIRPLSSARLSMMEMEPIR